MLFGWNTNVLERSSPNIKITCLPNKSILHCPSRSSCSAVSHFSEDISANKYSCLLFSSFAPLRLGVIILFFHAPAGWSLAPLAAPLDGRIDLTARPCC